MSSTNTAAAENAAPQLQQVRIFRITDIPNVMQHKLHWPVAASLMRRWFANSAYTMSSDVKNNRIDPRTLPASRCDESIVTMRWALLFSRVNQAYQTLYNGWKTSAGQALLKDHIKRSARSVPPKDQIQWRFGDLSQPAKVLDNTCQVNYIEIGSLSDPLDDFYGAIGKGILKIAVTGLVTTTETGRRRIAIDEIGVYLRDAYDFNDDSFSLISQPLGYWGFRGVERGVQLRWDIEIDEVYAEQDEVPADRLYAVQNDDFQR